MANTDMDAAADHCIAGVVLAAGFARRWGGEDKLLARPHGVPMLKSVVDALLAARIGPIVIVSRADRIDGQQDALSASTGQIEWIENQRAQEGMGTSLAAAACWFESRCPEHLGFAVTPGDIPLLRGETVEGLASAFGGAPGRPLRPIYRDVPGHPVFFPRAWCARLGELSGETGARHLLRGEACRRIEVADAGVIQDLDAPNS